LHRLHAEALENVWYNELAYCYPRVPDPFRLTPSAVRENLNASYQRYMFPSWRISKAYYTVYHCIRAVCDICGVPYRREEHASPLRALKATKLAPLSSVLLSFPFSLGYGKKTRGKQYSSYLSTPKPHLIYQYANHPRPPHETFNQVVESYIKDLRDLWKSWAPSRANFQLYMLPDLLHDFRVWSNYVDVRNMLSLYGEGFRGYLDMNLYTVVFFFVALVELVALAAFGPRAVTKCLREFETTFVHKSDALWNLDKHLPTNMRFCLYEHLGRLDGIRWAPKTKPRPQIELIQLP